MTTILMNRETAEELSVVFEKLDVFLQETRCEILRLENRARSLYQIFVIQNCYIQETQWTHGV